MRMCLFLTYVLLTFGLLVQNIQGIFGLPVFSANASSFGLSVFPTFGLSD